jgi:transposase InsO family protein
MLVFGTGPDRGSQYASQVMQARLAGYGMTSSMSRKGNCWDNAPTESFFNSLKNERSMVRATPPVHRPLRICSNTSPCSTTGDVATPRWATARRLSSCKTGSASITSKTWRHESGPLEGEKQGAPQILFVGAETAASAGRMSA